MGIIPRVRERLRESGRWEGEKDGILERERREGKNRRHTTMCLSLSYLPSLSSLSNPPPLLLLLLVGQINADPSGSHLSRD